MMKRYILPLLVALILLSAFQIPQQPDSKKLYEAHCQRCHGVDGNRGFL